MAGAIPDASMVMILVIPASLKRAANSLPINSSVQGRFGGSRKRQLSKLGQIEQYLHLRFSVLKRTRENPLNGCCFKQRHILKSIPKIASQNYRVDAVFNPIYTLNPKPHIVLKISWFSLNSLSIKGHRMICHHYGSLLLADSRALVPARKRYCVQACHAGVPP